MNQSRTFLGLALAACTLISASAFAGKKTGFTTLVSGNTAAGQVGDSRNSAGTAAVIACRLDVDAAGALSGLCWAQDDSFNYGSCLIPSAYINAYAQAIASATENSFYYFTWNGSGVCTHLQIIAGSNYSPATP